MRMNLVFFIVFLFSSKLFGITDYTEIDKKSLCVPDSLKTADQISAYLTKDLKNDIEKVRAFYIWITNNINYDLENKGTTKRFKSKAEVIDDVLKNRKGICQQYAELFHVFCQKSGIKSFVIGGYARNGQKQISDIAHSWNAVQIGVNYFFIDVTWASGYTINNVYLNQFRDEFFLIEPQLFVKTHLPFDPVWQFSDNPITIFDFNNQNFLKLSEKGNFNYRALIVEIEKQDRLTYLEQVNKRMLGLDELNDLLLDEIKENAFQITYEKGRIAADAFNTATDNYNLYIRHKNSRFRNPDIEDAKLRELISDVERPLYKADFMFQNVFTFNPDLRNQFSRFQKSIQEFEAKLKIESAFIDKYIKTNRLLRFLLFI